jgi:hypothetical protein
MRLFDLVASLVVQHAVADATASVAVFSNGIGGYPCVRVPSIIAVPGALLAFAECRSFVGDGCEPRGFKNMSTQKQARVICGRRSVDGGTTWGGLMGNISRMNASYPTATYHPGRQVAILQFSAWPDSNTPYLAPIVMQTTSSDFGLSWTRPVPVLTVPQVFLGGCRTDATPGGRIFFAGYTHPSGPKSVERNFMTSVWSSADGGHTYTMVAKGLAGGEPQVAVWDDRHIDVWLRSNGSISSRPFRSTTHTGGETWSAAKPTTVPADGLLLDSVKVGTFGAHERGQAPGQVLWLSAPAGPGRFNMTLFASEDNGSSWTATSKLYPSKGEIASYSCIEQVGNEVMVLWETAGGANCSGLCQISLHRTNTSDTRGVV